MSTPAAKRKVLLEASRAAVMAPHSAAGLCVTARAVSAARLLRVAESMARAAVALLSGQDLDGGEPAAQSGGSAQQSSAAPIAGASRSSRRRARARARVSAAAAMATEHKEMDAEAIVREPGRDASVGALLSHAGQISVDDDTSMEGPEVIDAAMAEQVEQSAQAPIGSLSPRLLPEALPADLAEFEQLCSAQGPEASHLIAQLLGYMGKGKDLGKGYGGKQQAGIAHKAKAPFSKKK